MLLSAGYSSPHWLTYRQAAELGGHIRQGETGLPVVYWKFDTRECQDGEAIVERRSVICRYYSVLNMAQCEGIKATPLLPADDGATTDPLVTCEHLVADWQAKPSILHGGDLACYSKVADCIQMPFRTSFDSAAEYFSTLFHELTHSTGHPARLNRPSLMDFERFGDGNYSREELVAEMGAAFLAGYCGIGNHTLNNSTAYLQSWLQALENDSRLVLVAAGQAQRAVDFILGQPSLSTPEVTR